MTTQKSTASGAFEGTLNQNAQAFILTILGSKVKTATAVANLVYFKKPENTYSGVWVTLENGKEFGLFVWDINQVTLTEFPEKGKPVHKRVADVLSEAYHANAGKPMEEALTNIAQQLVGTTISVYRYTGETIKGAPYAGTKILFLKDGQTSANVVVNL